MNREQWLTERCRGLGGSDAAAALGLSKWKTPYALYLEKRGEAPPVEETEPMRWGKLLEPVVIQRYADVTGRTVRTFQHELHWSDEYPFMFVSPDALAVQEKRGVEAKTARTREGWGEPGTDQIPQDYIIQVQHAMIVEKLPVFDVPVLFGGQDFDIYEVPADREVQEAIVESEHEFWQRVLKGDPPDPVNDADVRRRWGLKSIPNSVQAPSHVMEACARLNALRAEKDRVEEQCEALEVHIKTFMGENDTLVYGRNVLATWKASKPRETFDKEGLKAIHPDLYAQFTREGDPFRRFLLK